MLKLIRSGGTLLGVAAVLLLTACGGAPDSAADVASLEGTGATTVPDDAVLLALLGGLLGTLLGIAVTYGYADVRDITFSVPPTAAALGVGAALAVGALARLSPAARAARLPPADALRPA